MSNRVLIGGFLAFLAVAAVSGQSPQPSTSAPGGATVDKRTLQRRARCSTSTASAVTTRG